MRTTLDIDDDVLGIAKQLAHEKGLSAGKIVSDLVREALKPRKAPAVRNGIRLLALKADARPITLEEANRLRDEA